MPTQGFLDNLDTTTNKTILPNVVDLTFKNDPGLAYLKANCLEKWAGGPAWQENVLYGKLKGGAYAIGDSFDITQVQTKTGMTFFPKYYYVNATFFLEDTEVRNAGPMAVIKLADTAMQEAALGMSARLAISLYNDGQNMAGSDRSNFLNGLPEALNDGINAAWTGRIYTTYGTVPRNGTVGTALNAPMTSPTANIGGNILIDTLDQAHSSCWVGNEKPTVGLTTNLGLVYIKRKLQPQQRFEESDTVAAGWTAVKYNGAKIFQSQYVPGTQGVNDPDLGNYLDSNGEHFIWLNPKRQYIKFYVSTSPQFGFGTSGWKPAQNNNTVANQYNFSGNLSVPGLRYHRYLFGITG